MIVISVGPQQLQARIAVLESSATAAKPQIPIESPETKSLIVKLESRIAVLENKIAMQSENTEEKPIN